MMVKIFNSPNLTIKMEVVCGKCHDQTLGRRSKVHGGTTLPGVSSFRGIEGHDTGHSQGTGAGWNANFQTRFVKRLASYYAVFF